jgi:hypothetical protein
MVETRLRRLSQGHGISESEEFYFASNNEDIIIKVREGCLDIEEGIETCDDLERWLPRAKCESRDGNDAQGEVLAPLRVAIPIAASHQSGKFGCGACHIFPASISQHRWR